MKPIFFSMRNKVFAAMVVLVAGVLVAVMSLVSLSLSRQSDELLAENLSSAQRTFETLKEERNLRLLTGMQVVSEAPFLKAALDLKQSDPATVADVAVGLKETLRTDIFQVCDRYGRVLAALGGGPAGHGAAPPASGGPVDEYFARALDPKAPQATLGFLEDEGRLYLAVTGPVIIQQRVLGALRSGLVIDDSFADRLKSQSDTEVVFLVNRKVVASSLKDAQREAFAASLARIPSLASMSTGDEAARAANLDLSGEPFSAQILPLPDPLGRRLGHEVLLRSKAGLLENLRRLWYLILAVGFLGLVGSVAASYLLARNSTAGVQALVAASRQVAEGDLEARVKARSKDEVGELAEAFNRMVEGLKEKDRVKSLFGRYLSKAVAERVLASDTEAVLGGEQKEVTVLFADIRGFTALSERIPPPDVVAMLNSYFTRMVEVLLANEGSLDKYIGDAIMAVWGAPVSDDRGPEKAVRTALKMLEELKRYNEERASHGLQAIEIGIGINSGVVVAGNLGSVKQLSYTVIGDEVNLASRLCSHAAKGQILVSDPTYRRTKWRFGYNRLEPIMVKNISAPVQIYEALAELEDAGRAGEKSLAGPPANGQSLKEAQ